MPTHSKLWNCYKRLKRRRDTDGDTSSVEGCAVAGVGARFPRGGQSGGRTLAAAVCSPDGRALKSGRPLITFPDHSNFHTLTPREYEKLLSYLTSVASLQEADMGFDLIIDRRKDRWNSVKTVLIRISEFFPGIVQAVYVLRPAGFLQKALSEVSSKLFKEEFRFKVTVCSTVDEIYDYVEKPQLTSDLGGDLPYSHPEWIQQRITMVSNTPILPEPPKRTVDDFLQESSITIRHRQPENPIPRKSLRIRSKKYSYIENSDNTSRKSIDFGFDDMLSELLIKFE